VAIGEVSRQDLQVGDDELKAKLERTAAGSGPPLSALQLQQQRLDKEAANKALHNLTLAADRIAQQLRYLIDLDSSRFQLAAVDLQQKFLKVDITMQERIERVQVCNYILLFKKFELMLPLKR